MKQVHTFDIIILLKGVFIWDTALIYKCEAYMQTCLKDDMAHDPQHMYDRLYTTHAKEIAKKRRTAAQIYYAALVSEIVEGHSTLDRVS